MDIKQVVDELLPLSWSAIWKMREEWGYTSGAIDERKWFTDETCNLCGALSPYEGCTGLVKDHCHVTQFFRGFLCQRCNSAEGQNRSVAYIAWRLNAAHPAPGRRLYYKQGRPIEKFQKPVPLLDNAPMIELLTIYQLLGYR